MNEPLAIIKDHSSVDVTLENALQNLVDTSPQYIELVAQIDRLSRGGSKMRPTLFMLFYRGYGGKHFGANNIAASLELLHTFLIIHDDIIDHCFSRRGAANVAGHYLARFRDFMPTIAAEQAATAQALLAGDVCVFLAEELLAECNLAPEVVVKLQARMHACLKTTIAGEISDVKRSSAVPTEQDVLIMYREKTASYSFGLPLEMAALCTNQTDDLTALQAIAEDLGIAYQLQNDLHGIDDDIAQKTNTLLWCKTIELSGSPLSFDTNTTDEITRAMHESGAVRYVEKLITTLSQRAMKRIENLALDQTSRNVITEYLSSIF